MGALYAKGGKLFCNEYTEIYVPKDYFESNVAANRGATIETFGVVYIRSFPNGNEGPLQFINAPVVIHLMVYNSRDETIDVKGQSVDVLTLTYVKDSYIMRQSVVKGRETAELFLFAELNGKLPSTLRYPSIIDLWWRNMEMAGVDFHVPSKIYEMVIANTYRDSNNKKRRFGQAYAMQSNPSGLGYVASNVRNTVKDLSTFSGMVFEDMGTMISNGINNSKKQVEEQESPLEKIIHY